MGIEGPRARKPKTGLRTSWSKRPVRSEASAVVVKHVDPETGEIKDGPPPTATKKLERPEKRRSRTYERYLRSPAWKDARLRYIAAGRPQCCVWSDCGSTQWHLHHLTYERLGNELPEDLIALCPVHHRQLHRILRDSDEIPAEVLALSEMQ